jgi:Family of unknown function (DUF6144)
MFMDRKEFLRMGCCAFAFLASQNGVAAETSQACDNNRLTFIQNWVSDLMDTIDSEVDEETKIKLMSGCGRGCYQRHQFKQDIAAKGKGSVDKLIEAYKANFEVWREGEDKVHIRYGEVNKNGCYCPAANYRPGKPKTDIQCYCTRATHQSIWEAALGHPVKMDILQSVRRGDPTCHFLVHLA